jgi:uncharacterized membrane protein HdeD (DUF308 family)
MSGTLAVSIAIAAILVLVGLITLMTIWKRRKKGEPSEPNYRAFFVMGIVWFPVGLTSMIIYFLLDISFVVGIPLFAMGIIYMTIGLVNRDKWKKEV